MNDPQTTENRQPNVNRLREKYAELVAKGVEDVKFWYVGPRGVGVDDDVKVDDLAAEVLSIFEAYEKSDFVDISDKVK